MSVDLAMQFLCRIENTHIQRYFWNPTTIIVKQGTRVPAELNTGGSLSRYKYCLYDIVEATSETNEIRSPRVARGFLPDATWGGRTHASQGI